MAGHADSGSEEEDYMSDAFLAKCQDTRPGLLPSKTAKQYNQEKKHKEMNIKHKIKPKKQLEEEHRSAGLNQALDAGNKGFALMQKMGYKPGMAIGKRGTGLKEPISVEILARREGLGQKADRKRKQQEMAVMRAAMAKKRQKTEQTSKQDYRKEKSKQMMEKQTLGDLHSSQRVCETLDMEQSYTDPLEAFFWTPSTIMGIEQQRAKEKEDEDKNLNDELYSFEEQDDEESEDDNNEMGDKITQVSQMIAEEQLEILTLHLRKTYLYCVWCGTRFDSKEDLKTNCPGNTAQAHEDI